MKGKGAQSQGRREKKQGKDEKKERRKKKARKRERGNKPFHGVDCQSSSPAN